MSCHAVLQVLECMLSGHNKLWAVLVSEETLSHFAVIMAEHELMSAMEDLRTLIEPHDRFDELLTVLTDVDFQMFNERDQRVYKRIKSV